MDAIKLLVLLWGVLGAPWCGAEIAYDQYEPPRKPKNTTEAVDMALAGYHRRRGTTPPATTAISAGTPAPPAPVQIPAAPSLPAEEVSPEEALRGVLEQLDAGGEIEKLAIAEVAEPRDIADVIPTFDRVNHFFGVLNQTFFERRELMDILMRALISESSVLILGPGGTAKSDVADHIGENIFEDANDPQTRSYFTTQLTQDTTAAETHGGMIMEHALKGRMVRNWQEGILGSKIAFLDEFFDGRLKFLRSFLKTFNERKYTQGTEVFYGSLKFIIAASNKYLNQIYEAFGSNEPQALIDRFQYVYYAPGILRDTASILRLGEERPKMPTLTFTELDQLNAAMKAIRLTPMDKLRAQHIYVAMRRRLQARQDEELALFDKARARRERAQPPYRTTRVFSPRSLAIAFKLIKVEALIRAASTRQPARVESEDVDRALQKYLIMQGPAAGDLAPESDPFERAQNQTLRIEQDAWAEVMTELHEAEREELAATSALLERLDGRAPEAAVLSELRARVVDCQFHLGDLTAAEEISARTVAALGALRYLSHAPGLRRSP